MSLDEIGPEDPTVGPASWGYGASEGGHPRLIGVFAAAEAEGLPVAE
jgi:hypothetical protein